MVTSFLNMPAKVDDIFIFIVAISVFMLVLITALMVFFLFRYRRKRNPSARDIEGNVLLEISWTVIPTILVIAMFYYGWIGFKIMRTPPEDAMNVKVSARMWQWAFIYENGRRNDELNVPLDRPVKLIITSEDVLHSLFIPAYRIKEDAVPGMETYLWFLPDKIGTFDIFCSEYCGVGHHSMISKVNVMTPEDFSEWYEKREKAAAKRPDALEIMKRNGCLGCHTLDGTKRVGPSFKGIFGRKTEVVTNGRERKILADDDYLRRSILDPRVDVVEGFPDIMPSQRGILTDEEADAIIDYIKELK